MPDTRLWGLEIEFCKEPTPTPGERAPRLSPDEMDELQGDCPCSWAVVPDGSCGGEAVSPTLPMESLRGDVAEVLRFLSDEGLYAPHSHCGVHIHMGVSSPAEALAMLGIYTSVEPLLYQNLRVAADREDHYCRRLSNTEVLSRLYELLQYGLRDEALGVRGHAPERPVLTPTMRDACWVWTGSLARGSSMRHDKYQDERYAGFNLSSLWLHGTVELRLFNGTLDASRIEAYLDIAEGLWKLASVPAHEIERGRANAAVEAFCLHESVYSLLTKEAWGHFLDSIGASAVTKRVLPAVAPRKVPAQEPLIVDEPPEIVETARNGYFRLIESPEEPPLVDPMVTAEFLASYGAVARWEAPVDFELQPAIEGVTYDAAQRASTISDDARRAIGAIDRDLGGDRPAATNE